MKLATEQRKLIYEARKLDRDRWLAHPGPSSSPWRPGSVSALRSFWCISLGGGDELQPMRSKQQIKTMVRVGGADLTRLWPDGLAKGRLTARFGARRNGGRESRGRPPLRPPPVQKPGRLQAMVLLVSPRNHRGDTALPPNKTETSGCQE